MNILKTGLAVLAGFVLSAAIFDTPTARPVLTSTFSLRLYSWGMRKLECLRTYPELGSLGCLVLLNPSQAHPMPPCVTWLRATDLTACALIWG
jgi:hypothetical protein